MLRVLLTGILAVASCGGSPTPAQPVPASAESGPPTARVETVVETTFGVTLRDPYRWMEKPENSKELLRWMRAQGAYTRRQLDRIQGLPALRAQLRRLSMGASTVAGLQRRGTRLFYKRTNRGESVSRLYARDAGQPPIMVFDPTTGNAKAHAAIDNYAASPDGKRIAVNVSRGGAEITTIQVFEVSSGKRLPDSVGPVWGEFPATWLPDGSGFFYTQMAPEAFKNPKLDKMKNWKVRFHRLGTAAKEDAAVLGPGVAPGMPIAPTEFPVVDIPPGSQWAFGLGVGARESVRLAVVPLADLVRRPVPWRMIGEYADLITSYAVRGDDLFALTTNAAPNGKILRVDLKGPSLADATVVVPESSRVIQSVDAASDALYLTDLVAGTGGLRSVGYDGSVQTHRVPPGSSLRRVVADPRSGGVLLGLRGWTRPFGYVAANRSSGALVPIGLANTSTADLSKMVVERVEVPSTRGARVPMTILRSKDSPRDGKRPTIVYGYGAYGYTITPFHSPSLQAWTDRGGVYAICNVRGGGAKGRAWYLAGKGASKHNAVRDFVNCARYLVKRGYTISERVAGVGRSMAGVLVGRAATETPGAFGAISISAGMLNVLRVLEQDNGANQIAELGDPRSATGFKAILNMDAYHNVAAGKQYPAVLLSIGLNDNRVAPWMAGKFAARMQASDTRAPVLVRAEGGAGHGVGSTREQKSDKQAEAWAFLLHRFGHPDFGLTGKPAARK